MIQLSQGMVGKMLTVACIDGSLHSGECVAYIQALDNEPEVESISIGGVELFAPQIASISTAKE